MFVTFSSNFLAVVQPKVQVCLFLEPLYEELKGSWDPFCCVFKSRAEVLGRSYQSHWTPVLLWSVSQAHDCDNNIQDEYKITVKCLILGLDCSDQWNHSWCHFFGTRDAERFTYQSESGSWFGTWRGLSWSLTTSRVKCSFSVVTH